MEKHPEHVECAYKGMFYVFGSRGCCKAHIVSKIEKKNRKKERRILYALSIAFPCSPGPPLHAPSCLLPFQRIAAFLFHVIVSILVVAFWWHFGVVSLSLARCVVLCLCPDMGRGRSGGGMRIGGGGGWQWLKT